MAANVPFAFYGLDHKGYAVLLVESDNAHSDCCSLRGFQADPCSVVTDIFQSGRVLAMPGACTQTRVWVGVHAR